MPSYLVTGASGGLGYAFIKLFAAESGNTVIGIARDKSAVEQKLAEDGVKNVQIHQADITDRQILKDTATLIQSEVGPVDYLICSTGHSSRITLFRHLGDFEDNPSILQSELDLCFQTNVVGIINTINAFVPLVRESSAKKIIVLTSGMGDCDFVNETGMDGGAPYSISKAAANMVVAKYNATYKSDGVLVMGICAGAVDTHPMGALSDGDQLRMQAFGGKLAAYAPDFKGPVSPEKGAKSIMKVVYAAGLEQGSGGSHVSYMGTSRYL